MREYSPDGWAVLEIIDQGETHYRVFGSWTGGYLDGDSWRLSSGASIEMLEEEQDRFKWPQHSGSVYMLHKHGEGSLTFYNRGVLDKLMADIEEEGLEVRAHFLTKNFKQRTDYEY